MDSICPVNRTGFTMKGIVAVAVGSLFIVLLFQPLPPADIIRTLVVKTHILIRGSPGGVGWGVPLEHPLAAMRAVAKLGLL